MAGDGRWVCETWQVGGELTLGWTAGQTAAEWTHYRHAVRLPTNMAAFAAWPDIRRRMRADLSAQLISNYTRTQACMLLMHRYLAPPMSLFCSTPVSPHLAGGGRARRSDISFLCMPAPAPRRDAIIDRRCQSVTWLNRSRISRAVATARTVNSPQQADITLASSAVHRIHDDLWNIESVRSETRFIDASA